MIYKIVIPGKFATLNEFIDANRRGKGSWNKGNEMKQKDQTALSYQIRKQMKKAKVVPPVYIKYHFHEENKRRDMDNVSGYFHKIFQDALVQSGVIANDNWKYICGFSDTFSVDTKDKRIEVEIIDGSI